MEAIGVMSIFVLVLQVDLNLRQYLGHVGWMDAVVPGNVNVCCHHLGIERKM